MKFQSPTPGRAPGAMESGNFFYSKLAVANGHKQHGISFNPLSRGIFFIANCYYVHYFFPLEFQSPKSGNFFYSALAIFLVLLVAFRFNPLSRGIFFIAYRFLAHF